MRLMFFENSATQSKGKREKEGVYKNWKTQNCDCVEIIGKYHFLGNRGWF